MIQLKKMIYSDMKGSNLIFYGQILESKSEVLMSSFLDLKIQKKIQGNRLLRIIKMLLNY